MKKLLIALTVACCMGGNCIYAKCSGEKNYLKAYVKAKDVEIKNGRIFLKTKSGLCEVLSLVSSKKGLYVIKSLDKVTKDVDVVCPNCGQPVDSNDTWTHVIITCPSKK